MGRISISLPDSLLAKLEPIKDGINISQLCREALDQRVTAYERAAYRNGDNLDFDGLLHRLREERDRFGGKFEQLGKNNAAAWLFTGTYLEIQSVAEHSRSDRMHKYKLPRAAFKVMKQDMEDVKLTCDGPQAVIYKTAWLDYVKTVWSEILDQFEQSGEGEVTSSE